MEVKRRRWNPIGAVTTTPSFRPIQRFNSDDQARCLQSAQASFASAQSWMEPAWFQAVLELPPLPLPARAPSSRLEFDLPRSLNEPVAIAGKPLEVAYLEDELRRQFFRDHPFEAFQQRW